MPGWLHVGAVVASPGASCQEAQGCRASRRRPCRHRRRADCLPSLADGLGVGCALWSAAFWRNRVTVMSPGPLAGASRWRRTGPPRASRRRLPEFTVTWVVTVASSIELIARASCLLGRCVAARLSEGAPWFSDHARTRLGHGARTPTLSWLPTEGPGPDIGDLRSGEAIFCIPRRCDVTASGLRSPGTLPRWIDESPEPTVPRLHPCRCPAHAGHGGASEAERDPYLGDPYRRRRRSCDAT